MRIADAPRMKIAATPTPAPLRIATDCGSERSGGEVRRELPAQHATARRLAHAPIMNHPGASSLVQHPSAMRGRPSARDMARRDPEKAAEVLRWNTPRPALARECPGSHLKASPGVTEDVPSISSVLCDTVARNSFRSGSGVGERATIDEQFRRAKAQGHGQRVRVAMTVAQRAVRSGIDHRDSRARVPSVTKNGEAAARKIHVEPVRLDGTAAVRTTIRPFDTAQPIGEARRRLRRYARSGRCSATAPASSNARTSSGER